MLLLALMAPWAANAQETLTVCDGTSTSSYAPIKNGGGSQTEFIYPASLLGDMEGGTITSVKFFSTSTSTTNYSNTVTVFVEEVASSTISASAWQYNQSTATKVYEGTTLSVTGGELVITFSTPFEYNGGNLCFNIWSASNTPDVYYYYLATTNSCGYDWYITPPVSNPYSTGSYLPKAEFTYTAVATCCPKPKNLTCTGYTANTATFTWTNGGDETQWQLEYGTASDFSGATTKTIYQSDLVNGAYTLTGLTAEQTYYARIKAYCPSCTPNYSDPSNTCEFKPSAVQTVTIGSGTSTFYYLPTHTNYKYSYSQQIYTAAEVGEPGTITSVSFKGGTARTRTLDIYMVNTDKASFSSTSDFIAVSEADRVFSGSVSFVANDWTEIEVDFDYTGENLAIIVDDNTGSDPGSTSWSSFTVSSNQSVYYYQDASNISPSLPTSASNKYYTTSKNQIILSILPSSTPKPRNLVVSNITSDGATVTWEAPAANVTGYQYQYKYATTPTWPDTWNSLAANVTHKDLTLQAGTLYDFRVKANYADGDSDPAEIQFTTEATCLPVTDIIVSDITSDGAKLAWTPGGTEINWQYLTVAHGDTPDWTSDRVLTSNVHANVPANIAYCTGQPVQPNTEYDFYVRANCGGGDYSEAAMLTFRTACGAITSFPITYGFETSEGFPSNASTPTTNQLGDCWRNEATVQNGTSATRVWGTSTSSKHNGSQALVLPDKGNSSNPAKTMLVFPAMNFTNANGYTVSFWIYRSGSSSNPEGFKLYVSDTDTISANAIELGHYSRNYSIAYPVVESGSGWYQYETAPITMTGTVYLIFEGQSYYGSGTYVDDITIKEYVSVTANQIVETVSDPATEMTWSDFVSHWNAGDHFTSSTFTLMDDITVSTMVGTADKPFTGTFDGNSHTITVSLTATDNSFTAPFRVIKNATIQNLKVDGTINDGGHKFCAGFAGDCYGNNTFTNCVSDVTINATIEGDGTHGGFIARNYGGSSSSSSNLCTTVFNGCAFTGQLLGSSTNQCGGFCGWSEYQSSNYARTTFNNCVFDPQQVTMSTTSAAAFARRRSASYLTISNCYFMQDFNDGTNNTAQGKQAYTITGAGNVTVAMAGTHTDYSVSGISAYTNGIVYNSNIYAGDGETVTLTLSGAPGYEANHGTLEASGANYTLAMEAFNTEISGVNCPVPFNVAANDVTATSAKIAWEGNSDTYKLMYRNVITPTVAFDETYDFEDGWKGWTTESNDADDVKWTIESSSDYSHGGTYYARARYTSSGNGEANDWLISPQIPLGGTLSFYARRYSTSYTDRFQVYVSTTENNISDFTAISEVITPNTTYDLYEYDLSSYSGNGYVAIVYTAPNNQYYVYVDDIHITASIEGQYGEWQTVNPAVSAQPIGSLTPETTYQVKVSGFCNGVETDESSVVEFTTPATCPAPTALAVTEGSVTAHEATITWTENGEATTWIVEYADNADFTNFSTETVEDDATYSFDELDGETTYYVRVKAHCGEEDESYYSNVVNFTTLVACPAPTVLTVTEITTTSAKLSWTENGTATAWQICLNGDETNLIPADSNPFVLDEGLTASTSYTVKVRANCGGIDGESGWSNTVSFNTLCESVTTFPWNENFNGLTEANSIPNCWNNDDGDNIDNSYKWCYNTSTSGNGATNGTSHDGSKCVRFNSYSTTEDAANFLKTPVLSLPNSPMQLSFWYKNPAGGDFSVYISTDGGETYTTSLFTDLTDQSTWEQKTYDLTSYAGQQNVVIVFGGTSNWGYGDAYIYLDDVEITYCFTKTITGVGAENWENGKGGYYLIASPLAAAVDPTTITGMTTGDYDLYSFDQAATDEWRNYKDDTENGGGFDLINGKGYLYANKNDVTLTVTGAPGTNGEVTLHATDSVAGLEFSKWNLVGNPFGQTAYLSRAFYSMQNAGGFTANTEGGSIGVMEGVFVIAESDGETLTFSTASKGKVSQLNLNLTKGNSLMDRAIVRFDEGSQLPKLQFRNGSTKVYIPQEGKDYAIVSAESSMGEMPVNFKAENNGSYTLSFTSEEVSFAYLHLIDNMTGIETDLLANPSYSFDARTTDYESRFKLVFATGNNANDDNFAFFSNGSFVINNEGEATLQVIDMNGRILKSESINGCANVNVKAAAGVYMLRLVNGNDVKVQKVVVR